MARTGSDPWQTQAEFYLNNVRERMTMSADRLSLLPSGTASNEALHRELNAMFRETQQLHQSTLVVKLACIRHLKQLAHARATFQPTLRQLSSRCVLARASLESPWTPATWRSWCSTQIEVDALRVKAVLPMADRRKQEMRLVSDAIRKRPAGFLKRPASSRKTTVFTRRRLGSLVLGGVRKTVWKGHRQ